MPPEDWKSHTYPTTSWKNRMSLHPTKGKQHPDDLFPTRYREHSCLTHLPDDANDLPVLDEDSVPVHSQLLDSGTT